MEKTVWVKKEGRFFKIPVGNSDFKFVKGTCENVIVSSKGEIIRRYPTKLKKGEDYYQFIEPRLNLSTGFLQIKVSGGIRKLHKMVAEAFVSKPKGCNKVDYINNDPYDLRAENLRWIRKDENRRISYPWTDIVAFNYRTGTKHTFKEFEDITLQDINRSKDTAGKKWRCRILYKLHNGGGKAFGFLWTAKKITD